MRQSAGVCAAPPCRPDPPLLRSRKSSRNWPACGRRGTLMLRHEQSGSFSSCRYASQAQRRHGQAGRGLTSSVKALALDRSPADSVARSRPVARLRSITAGKRNRRRKSSKSSTMSRATGGRISRPASGPQPGQTRAPHDSGVAAGSQSGDSRRRRPARRPARDNHRHARAHSRGLAVSRQLQAGSPMKTWLRPRLKPAEMKAGGLMRRLPTRPLRIPGPSRP